MVGVHAPSAPLGDQLGQGRWAIQRKDNALLGLAQAQHLIQPVVQQQVEMVDVICCIAVSLVAVCEVKTPSLPKCKHASMMRHLS